MSWILIVDDEPAVARALKRTLQREGLEPIVVNDLREALSVLQVRPIALILLDLRIGNRKSFDFAREVSEEFETPIMFVTGSEETLDKVIAFEIGAYDYITKPFEDAELVARVRSILRRTDRKGVNNPANSAQVFDLGDWRVDFRRWHIEPDIKLTRFEFRLLKLLVHNQGVPVTRDQISLAINRRAHHPTDRTIDVIVSKLRVKLGAELIETIRGEGYSLGVEATPVDEDSLAGAINVADILAEQH